ncbi:MAG: AbrB/MazE/SpoVT family DNA-binding domain-containing protein [Oscillospiraceae bacterium]|nr:AbrB/MazE/SpoVT family DNA-binding domain-containing protein [Oscillospiraceae bacterium]
MKATGIVRRIDDLGRVVIPKEIRRTMRIREGDPLEIYTSREGEVIFKKYSLIGGLEDFAAQFCDTLNRSTNFTAAVTDRDSIIAIAGNGKRELLGKPISSQLEEIMEQRGIYRYAGEGHTVPVSDSSDKYTAAVAAPILCEGDVLGLVVFLSAQGQAGGETEYKLAQTVAAFLGRHMEG